MHQPFLAQEIQTVKKDTLSEHHASIFLLHFFGISASVVSISHHWDYKVQRSSETILDELFFI